MMRRILMVGSLALAMAGPGNAQEKSGAEKKAVTPEAFLELRSIQDPQFSPDGTRVAFIVGGFGTGEKRTRHIWIYEKEKNASRQLTYSTKSESSPRWSPDGKQLLFLSNRDGDEQQIYILRMEGGEAAQVTKGKASASEPAWSPDGKTIAYLAPDPKTEAEEKKEKDKNDERVVDRDDKHARLRLIDLATKQARTLTEPTWKVEELDWMPDGQTIVVKATDRPAVDRFTDRLYGVTVQDAKVKELLAPRGPFGNIHVSHDGKGIAFIGCRDDGPQPHDLQILPTGAGLVKNLTGASLDRQIMQLPVGEGWMGGGGVCRRIPQ